jgi:hypothetical protein
LLLIYFFFRGIIDVGAFCAPSAEARDKEGRNQSIKNSVVFHMNIIIITHNFLLRNLLLCGKQKTRLRKPTTKVILLVLEVIVTTMMSRHHYQKTTDDDDDDDDDDYNNYDEE